MTRRYQPIIDANINRLSEGLRVIEEYTRFVASDKPSTTELAHLRHAVRENHCNQATLVHHRNSQSDQRHNEPPPPRETLLSLLRANFSRVTESCRVLEEYTNDPAFTTYRYAVYDLEKQVITPLLSPPIPQGIYYIADAVDRLINSIKQGAAMIQLRDKQADKQTIFAKAQAIQAKRKATDAVPFIVNDHADIAIAVQANGLHTGQDDLPLAVIRQQLGHQFILGRTCHSIAQAVEAQDAGADYVSLGPIYETPSKPNRPAVGTELLADAHEALTIPFVVIGGINLDTIHTVLPYAPPLIGLIRDYANIPTLRRHMTHL